MSLGSLSNINKPMCVLRVVLRVRSLATFGQWVSGNMLV